MHFFVHWLWSFKNVLKSCQRTLEFLRTKKYVVDICFHHWFNTSFFLAKIKHAWLLYKSTTIGEGYLSANLKSFTVIDNRDGTEEEFRLAVGNSESIGYANQKDAVGAINSNEKDLDSVPTMIILDAKFTESLMSISLCVQRPQLLVALDFLLSVVEFFVPTIADMISNEEDGNSSHIVDAFLLDQSTFIQKSAEVFLSPKKPLVADDERFDFFIYDGGGGIVHLQDRNGQDISAPSKETMIYIGNGKRVQFKNVIIKVCIRGIEHVGLDCIHVEFLCAYVSLYISIFAHVGWKISGFMCFTGDK